MFFLFDISLKLSMNLFKSFLSTLSFGLTIPIFVKEDKIISGGNFHGQPLAYAIDFLKISISELGSISERRVFNLMSGKRGLPPFLINDPGLNSGLMILHTHLPV